MKAPLPKHTNHAVALVSVLLILALLTILILTYLSSMQIEHRSAVAFSDTQRAKMVSQGAVAHSIELLRTSIPEPAGIDVNLSDRKPQNWVINPGRLTIYGEEGEEQIIDLHTGGADVDPASTTDPDVYSVDLNEPVPRKLEPTICRALDPTSGLGIDDPDSPHPEMRVKWVNILEDPSQEPSRENQIVARHAFWIDDESSKLNFNTALGKPARGVDANFDRQKELGMMPRLYHYPSGTANRNWALGKLRSVNLDVMFDDLPELDWEEFRNELLAHAMFRGHSRHPEAILSHIHVSDSEKLAWWHRNRYNLTFYSRSPEFNVFGRPRFMTTNIPLSLEGGPYYQMPFVYQAGGATGTLKDFQGILHLHSLMGSLGFGLEVQDKKKDGGKIGAPNLVNRAQAAMLMQYFGKTFPGYAETFIEKYGEAECAQIALNILNMARFATTTMRDGNVNNYSIDMSARSTSVLYSPHEFERKNHTPERHYWRFQPGSGENPGRFLTKGDEPDDATVPMIPSTPGPHIMEVRLLLKPFPALSMPEPHEEGKGWQDNPINGGTPLLPPKKWLGFRFHTEYYHQGGSPFVRTWHFPFRVDYLKIELSGEGVSFTQELGPEDADDAKKAIHNRDKNWAFNLMRTLTKYDKDGNIMYFPPNHNRAGQKQPRRVPFRRSLGSVYTRSGKGTLIRPFDPATEDETKQRNRLNIAGPWNYIGRNKQWLGNVNYPYPQPHHLPRLFNHLEMADTNLNVKITFRGGMTIGGDQNRCRQMIPLGEGINDTLQGEVTVDLSNPQPVSISWQIIDPQLSSHKDMWLPPVTSDDNQAGTPGAPHPDEPAEDSNERSKFRYFQRGPGNISGLPINRPDEYDSRSRVSSKGFWSVLPTGIQSKVPWRTLRLSPPKSTDPPGPPDWLLMDLIGGTYPMQHAQWEANQTLPDEFSTVSYMHSTAGAINLNSRPFPDDSKWFQAPQRKKPLEAVFKHLRPDDNIQEILEAVSNYQESNRFKYVGELSEIDGYLREDPEATDFENEELLRNMIGCLTTRSNTFGVWGVGQVVKKIRSNEDWGKFEDGDVVRGEKRFFALIERYIWPGKDGVPGNAHVNSSGVWDRKAQQSQEIEEDAVTDRLYSLPGSPPVTKGEGKRLGLDTAGTYPEFDGPQEVTMDKYASAALGNVVWRESTLEEAYNPPQAVIKYKVVYFKYLNE